MASNYATILMGRQQEESLDTGLGSNSAVFGSVSRMSSAIERHDDSHRIAVYPCVGAEEAGTGLLLMLGQLLGSAHHIKLYPVILQLLENDVISDESFTPDDWVLDDLDDDIAIWGSLSRQDDSQGWSLKIWVEDDAMDGQLLTFEKSAQNWNELFNLILDLAGEIAEQLGLKQLFSYPAKLTVRANEEAVKAFSAALFGFYRDMIKSALQGAPFADFPLENPIIQAANQVAEDEEAISWSAAAALGYETVLRDHLDLLGDQDSSYTSYPEALTHWERGAAIFSLAVMNNDEADAQASTTLSSWCLEQLEGLSETFPTIAANWIALSIFYNKLKRPDLAIDVCQRALESDIDDDVMYFAYADSLSETLEVGYKVDRLVLYETGNPSNEAHVRLERVMSLERGIASHPKANAERLSQYVVEAAKHEKITEIQPAFERLTENNPSGEIASTVIDQLAHLDDLDWMIPSLEKATTKGGFQAWLNLAKVLLMTEDILQSRTAAQKALDVAAKTQQRADAQLLLLELDIPEIQADLADILARLQVAEDDISERDVEFLEYLVENAPAYAEGYLALASAYQKLDEPNTALEVLLDAERLTDGTPELYLALSDLFEQEDELTLAIENVRKGLDIAPVNVPLLAQAALLAYLSAEEEGAQAFLRRAHAISPYHPWIVKVTRRIQSDEDSDDDE